MISETELKEIELRCVKAQKGPWKAWIEGRDHQSGTNIIQTAESSARGEDIEMTGATVEDLDFIAHARQDIPKLIAEIRGLMKQQSSSFSKF